MDAGTATEARTRRGKAVPPPLADVRANYVKLPRPILRLLCSGHLSEIESRIIAFIAEKTFGSFARLKRSSIDLSVRAIGRTLRIDHGNVVRALKRLKKKGIVAVTDAGLYLVADSGAWDLGQADSGVEEAPEVVSKEHQRRCRINTTARGQVAEKERVRPRVRREETKKRDIDGGTPESTPSCSPPPEITETSKSTVPGPLTVETLAEVFNREKAETHPAAVIDAHIRALAEKAIPAFPDLKTWTNAFRELRFSDFLQGTKTEAGAKPFVARFSWFLKRDGEGRWNVEKVLERKYRDRGLDCPSGYRYMDYLGGAHLNFGGR